jgi:hypothetical protein
MRSHCACNTPYSDKYKFWVDKVQTATGVRLLDSGPTANSQKPQIDAKGIDETPTVVIIDYTDVANDYRDASYEYPETLPEGTERREVRFNRRGITTEERAKRWAKYTYNRLQLDKQINIQTMELGLRLEPGDRIGINSRRLKADGTDESATVVETKNLDIGWSALCELYRASVFDYTATPTPPPEGVWSVQVYGKTASFTNTRTTWALARATPGTVTRALDTGQVVDTRTSTSATIIRTLSEFNTNALLPSDAVIRGIDLEAYWDPANNAVYGAKMHVSGASAPAGGSGSAVYPFDALFDGYNQYFTAAIGANLATFPEVKSAGRGGPIPATAQHVKASSSSTAATSHINRTGLTYFGFTTDNDQLNNPPIVGAWTVFNFPGTQAASPGTRLTIRYTSDSVGAPPPGVRLALSPLAVSASGSVSFSGAASSALSSLASSASGTVA